ncbi:hypothetical protein LOAG_12590 [Loa loa]|uniref:Uncharacterized protein n=1 Tax=Loa loa TaxID=7209 RepID=A0A1S0TME6_LOALO|nr:hypothetical protein LOAG_12590 [Loa loa]EFO15919.1 hypothetical protein LOAG_12590 [Loa loa]
MFVIVCSLIASNLSERSSNKINIQLSHSSKPSRINNLLGGRFFRLTIQYTVHVAMTRIGRLSTHRILENNSTECFDRYRYILNVFVKHLYLRLYGADEC